MKESFENQLMKCAEGGKLKRMEPLSLHTTFRIGGPADYLIEPETPEKLLMAIELCHKEKVPYYVIGNGSNLLAGDKGFRGVILKICRCLDHVSFAHMKEDGKCQVVSGAGILLSKLAVAAAEEGLLGLEFAAGIPGTLGGAVTMNAGAYGGEIKDSLVSAKVISREGQVKTFTKEELCLGYRSSAIQKNKDILIEAEFLLKSGNKEQIKKRMQELNQQRKEKQPLEYPSAGSTFKRPEGYFAGKLIMDAGLSGYQVGDIMVSTKHCGFVINKGSGTAAQARQLIEDVKHIVFEKSGVRLEPEVRFIGEF